MEHKNISKQKTEELSETDIKRMQNYLFSEPDQIQCIICYGIRNEYANKIEWLFKCHCNNKKYDTV
jgi:hypothetical protein